MLKFVVSVIAFAYVCALSLYAGDEYVETRSKALAHFIMAGINDFNGQVSDAVMEYERSSSLDRNQPLPHLRLASYYARAGLLDKSLEQLQAVLTIDPSNAQAHYLKALVYTSQKKIDLAAKEYQMILASKVDNSPENLEIHVNLAQMFFSQKKYLKAIEEFQQILNIDPDNVSTHYLMGTAYLEINDHKNAVEYFKKVLSIEPNNDQALNSLAYVYAQEGENLDEALVLIQRAIEIDVNSGAYYDTLGWVLYKKGSYAESLIALQKAEMYLKDPILFEHMGDVYRSIGENALARKYWNKALDLDPQQTGLQLKISDLEKTQAKQ